LEERAPKAKVLDREEALRELTLRYFQSHGPAQARDFAWWSGLAGSNVDRGLGLARGELVEERVEEKTYWFWADAGAREKARQPFAHLLSLYDEYTIAYNDRSALGEGRVLEGMISRGYAMTSVIIVDGRVAGA